MLIANWSIYIHENNLGLLLAIVGAKSVGTLWRISLSFSPLSNSKLTVQLLEELVVYECDWENTYPISTGCNWVIKHSAYWEQSTLHYD